MRTNPNTTGTPSAEGPADESLLGPRARSFARSHWEWAFQEAQRGGHAFSCVVIVVDGAQHVPVARRAEWEARAFVEIERSVERMRASHEILFGVEPGRALLAILGGGLEDAGALAADVARDASGARALLPVPGLSMGIASNHASAAADLDGLFLETLLAVAADGAAVAGVGGAWVHTELYGLVQRRLDVHGFCAPAAACAGASALPAREEQRKPSREPESGHAWREIMPRTIAAPVPATSTEQRPEEQQLEDLVLSALKRAGLNRSEASAAEGILMPSLVTYLAHQRMRSGEENRTHVGRLERRISKLNRQLEELERAGPHGVLDGGRGGRQDESGLSSVFREVQGLSPVDDQFQLKSHLLEAILQANLELVACSPGPSGASTEADAGRA